MGASVLASNSIGESVKARFRDMFGAEARLFRAPGRVNLIGEHTDYNGGFVMPAAIQYYTWVAAAKRKDPTLEVYSDHFCERISLPLDSLAGPPRKHWSDFVRGVAATLQDAGYPLCGANLFIHGEVPLGAGLSSSASLEVATAMALSSFGGNAPRGLELVKLCQRAEHEYVGTRCGIMDQFAATFAIARHALMLDCRTLEYQQLPFPNDLSLVVCNSMAKHELASGEYNRRRADCESAVRILQSSLPRVGALRDVTVTDLEKFGQMLPALIRRRCRHVVTENQRVTEAATALRSGDANQLGQLMYSSHASLRDDYEVSCKELDLLVELASSISGVYGARMTGGGFGGCTVNLLRADCVDAFRDKIKDAYQQATGIQPEIYVCKPAQGAEAEVSSGGFPT